jgi:hypothetical protein
MTPSPNTLSGKVHFLSTKDPITSSHLRYLSDHFARVGIEHTAWADDGPPPLDAFEPGHAYVACNLLVDDWIEPVRDQVFSVQLAHNLTGLKGTPFGLSRADLNVLPGRQIAECMGLRGDDPRYVIGGYPKWDRIYPERFVQARRRADLAAASGMDPSLPWVVFYPTGPMNKSRANVARAGEIFDRVRRSFGAVEYFFCDHAHNRTHRGQAGRFWEGLPALAEREPRFHVIDGAGCLAHIAACDLFITDIASTVITAISMDKPILFIAVPGASTKRSQIERFQAAPLLRDVPDIAAYVRGYATPPALAELYARCVRYDDDGNCARITSLVADAYDSWRAGR